MPGPNGESEKMKKWNRPITQEEWDAIFPPEPKFCSGCGLRLSECNEECHEKEE